MYTQFTVQHQECKAIKTIIIGQRKRLSKLSTFLQQQQ
jgi:hypothetical protein